MKSMPLPIRFKRGKRNNCNFKLKKMLKLKGVKVIKNKRGKPKQLLIDIDKHYDIVEDLVDVIEAESRLNEPTIPAEEVYRKIQARFKKKRTK